MFLTIILFKEINMKPWKTADEYVKQLQQINEYRKSLEPESCYPYLIPFEEQEYLVEAMRNVLKSLGKKFNEGGLAGKYLLSVMPNTGKTALACNQFLVDMLGLVETKLPKKKNALYLYLAPNVDVVKSMYNDIMRNESNLVNFHGDNFLFVDGYTNKNPKIKKIIQGSNARHTIVCTTLQSLRRSTVKFYVDNFDTRFIVHDEFHKGGLSEEFKQDPKAYKDCYGYANSTFQAVYDLMVKDLKPMLNLKLTGTVNMYIKNGTDKSVIDFTPKLNRKEKDKVIMKSNAIVDFELYRPGQETLVIDKMMKRRYEALDRIDEVSDILSKINMQASATNFLFARREFPKNFGFVKTLEYIGKNLRDDEEMVSATTSVKVHPDYGGSVRYTKDKNNSGVHRRGFLTSSIEREFIFKEMADPSSPVSTYVGVGVGGEAINVPNIFSIFIGPDSKSNVGLTDTKGTREGTTSSFIQKICRGVRTNLSVLNINGDKQTVYSWDYLTDYLIVQEKLGVITKTEMEKVFSLFVYLNRIVAYVSDSTQNRASIRIFQKQFSADKDKHRAFQDNFLAERIKTSGFEKMTKDITNYLSSVNGRNFLTKGFPLMYEIYKKFSVNKIKFSSRVATNTVGGFSLEEIFSTLMKESDSKNYKISGGTAPQDGFFTTNILPVVSKYFKGKDIPVEVKYFEKDINFSSTRCYSSRVVFLFKHELDMMESVYYGVIPSYGFVKSDGKLSKRSLELLVENGFLEVITLNKSMKIAA